MKTSRYWISQLLPLAVVGYGAVHFRDFLHQAIKSNPPLNLTILGAILLSASVCLWRMVVFSREVRAIDTFHHEYQRTRSNQAAAQKLGDGKTYMAGLLRVVGEMRGPLTSRLNQAALHLEFEELRSSYAQMLALPQFLSGFMIAMGLFGTFIGLLETLGATASFISVVANSSGSDADGAIVGLIKGIQGPLAGMGTAFSASLFGLLGSLVTGAMLNGLQSLSHKLVHGTRRQVEQILPVEPEVEVVTATDITPELLLGVADRPLRHEQTATERYIASKQMDMETRAQIREASLQMNHLLVSLDAMVRQLVPSGEATAQHNRHMADLVLEMRRQNQLMGEVPVLVAAAETAAGSVQRTGTNIERMLAAATAQEQRSALMEGQLTQSHALLGSAVRSLNERQEATDAVLARIADGAASLPMLSHQMEAWSHLAEKLTDANAAWLSGVQEINADTRSDMLTMLGKMEREFARLVQLNAATTERTQSMAEQLLRPSSGMPTHLEELMREATRSLAAIQLGQEELLKEVWRRQGSADRADPAH